MLSGTRSNVCAEMAKGYPRELIIVMSDTMKGHVHVHFRYRSPYAELIVSDTGVGIPGKIGDIELALTQTSLVG